MILPSSDRATQPVELIRGRNETPAALVVTHDRILETPQLYPGYVIPLAGLTAALITIELGFAARLIDAIGSAIHESQLAPLATWGWGLTGAAVTLLLCGSFILPWSLRHGWTLSRRGAALLLATIICCETSYLAGPLLVRLAADRMSAAELQCAVQLRTLAIAAQHAPGTESPLATRWALARAPLAGLSCEGLPGISPKEMTDALRSMVARRIGTDAQVYDNVFIPSVRSLKDAYNEYVAAQLRLVTAIREIPAQQSRTWQQYLDQLATIGLVPAHIPQRQWPQIAAEVRAMGVPVAPNWNPADKAAFLEALATQIRQAADASYNEFIVQRFQRALPPGLNWEQFYGQTDIQARWKTVIAAPDEASLSPNMGFQAFRQTVYEPRVERLVEPALRRLLAQPEEFLPGRSLRRAGEAAALWVLTPAWLLVVTVIAILIHLVRFSGLLGRIAFPRLGLGRRWVALVSSGAVVALLIAALRALQPAALSADKDVAAEGAGWLRQEQSGSAARALGLLGAVGSGVRNVVLGGFTFGYDPALTGELGETAFEPLLPDFRMTP